LTAVRVFESDEYLPEYGLLVLRDPAVSWASPPPLPHSHDRGDEPTGTFAGSGAGWITCQAGDGRHRVRLERHDEPPDAPDLDDVAELPYLSSSGGLSLTWLTGGAGKPDLVLGGAGHYRVRAGRGPDRWLLQFWPVSDIEPPAWRRRSRPAVGAGNSGWQTELGYELMELAGIVSTLNSADGEAVTVERLDRWGRAHHRPDGWLDAPVWPLPRIPLPTGHADLDQRNAAQYAEVVRRLEGQQRRLDEIALELGAAPVLLKRDGLPLLAAAGVLIREANDRYRTGEPARVDTVLSLPPERARLVRAQDARSRYGRLAEDLESVLRWSGRMPLEIPAGELAARLLVDESALRAGLGYAEETGLLHAGGSHAGGSGEPLVLTLGRRAPDTPERAPRPDRKGNARIGAIDRFTSNSPVKSRPNRRPPRPEIPFGKPARAGVLLTDGTFTDGADGVPRNNVRLEAAAWTRALQTARGILVAGPNRAARLIATAGGIDVIDDVRQPNLLLMGDGKRVALSDNEHHRLRVVDLDGGPTVTMPGSAGHPVTLVGVHRDTIWFTAGHGSTMCWTPGGEPRAAEHPFQQIDPLTGTGLTRTARGITVYRPDRTEVTVPVDLTARLTPGGDRLWTARANPPAVTLFPVRPHPKPQVHWLPEGSYREPIWEDREHLLLGFPAWHFQREPAAGIRLSLRNGMVERLPAAGRPMVFVEPFLTT
jgi:hypothetical protein